MLCHPSTWPNKILRLDGNLFPQIITDLQLQKLQIWQPLQQRVLLLNANSCKCCRFKMLKFAIQFDWLNMKSVASLWSAYPENTVLTTINACYPTRLPLCPPSISDLISPKFKVTTYSPVIEIYAT